MIESEALQSRIDELHELEVSELNRLGRAVLEGRPGLPHRTRVVEIRLDLDGLYAAQRLSRHSRS